MKTKTYSILWTDGTTTEETFNTLSGLNVYLNIMHIKGRTALYVKHGGIMQKSVFSDAPREVSVFDPARLH